MQNNQLPIKGPVELMDKSNRHTALYDLQD